MSAHDKRRDYRIVVVAVVVGLAGLLLPLLVAVPRISGALYLIATSLVSLEVLDLTARLWLSRAHARTDDVRSTGAASWRQLRVEPFALVMSVHNLRSAADLVLRPLVPYKAQTWIIDDASTDDTALYLNAMGWRCLAARENRKKPGAIRALLKLLPQDIKTVVVLDPDTAPTTSGRLERTDLELALQRFQHSGAAACCPRFRIREGNWLTSFQVFECELTFALGRKGMSPNCVVSGVSIYDRDALSAALETHSLSVYAEDLENSLILLDRRHRIYYDDQLTFATEGEADPFALFSQRVGWSFGLLRVYAARWREVLNVGRRNPWTFYNFVIYLGVLAILLLPLKLVSLVILTASFANALDALLMSNVIPDNGLTNPAYFASAYLVYTLIAACMALYLRPAMSPRTLISTVPFIFFYGAIHLIAISVGFLNWISLRAVGRRVYRDRYMAEMGTESPRERAERSEILPAGG